MRGQIIVALIAAAHLSAATVVKDGVFGGMHITYKVLLPDGYDSAREYPTILAFGGGEQSVQFVDIGLQRYWGGEARHRGYVVVSPAANVGTLLYQDGAKIFPEFLDMVVRDYRPQGGRMHAAGYSNGGVTAFYVAATYPKYFLSVTGLPGALRETSDAKIEALKSMCIDMYVGGNDAGWRDNMAEQYSLFRQKGYTVRFRVMENQNHVLSLSAEDLSHLFDHLDAAAKGCGKEAKR